MLMKIIYFVICFSNLKVMIISISPILTALAVSKIFYWVTYDSMIFKET